jgi:hypothetical protein
MASGTKAVTNTLRRASINASRSYKYIGTNVDGIRNRSKTSAEDSGIYDTEEDSEQPTEQQKLVSMHAGLKFLLHCMKGILERSLRNRWEQWKAQSQHDQDPLDSKNEGIESMEPGAGPSRTDDIIVPGLLTHENQKMVVDSEQKLKEMLLGEDYEALQKIEAAAAVAAASAASTALAAWEVALEVAESAESAAVGAATLAAKSAAAGVAAAAAAAAKTVTRTLTREIRYASARVAQQEAEMLAASAAVAAADEADDADDSDGDAAVASGGGFDRDGKVEDTKDAPVTMVTSSGTQLVVEMWQNQRYSVW